jgi:hypothetical protein
MRSRFHAWQELFWSVLISGATVLLIELAAFDPGAISDARVWAIALGSGVLRSMAGAALDWIRRGMVEAADPVLEARDAVLALSPAERERLVRLVELEAQRG